jgi:hypothetical protein
VFSRLVELLDGKTSLICAVEKFDSSRGFKFRTYASWAIMKNFGSEATPLPYLDHRCDCGKENNTGDHEESHRHRCAR